MRQANLCFHCGANAVQPTPLLAKGRGCIRREASCDRLLPDDSSSGGWDRTTDTRLMKPR
jgi:hypothetical protein